MNAKRMLAIPLVLIILSSCAALSIKTWIVKSGDLIHGTETKTVAEAEGFRCYSELDDTAWRTELKIQRACCSGRSQ